MDIKYSIMELKENDKLIAYMVAKCYVIKEPDTYKKTADPNNTYEVVFEWEPNGKTDIVPIYDNEQNCVNSTKVACVFDKLKECKQKAEDLNDELARKEIKDAKLWEVRDLVKVLKQNLQTALDMQEEHLKPKQTELVR